MGLQKSFKWISGAFQYVLLKFHGISEEIQGIPKGLRFLGYFIKHSGGLQRGFKGFAWFKGVSLSFKGF